VAPIVILSKRPKGVGSGDSPALASQLRVKLGVMRPPMRLMSSAAPPSAMRSP
jgi:hypothetical protein